MVVVGVAVVVAVGTLALGPMTWLTAIEAAAHLRIDRSTLYKLARQGLLRPDGRVGCAPRWSQGRRGVSLSVDQLRRLLEALGALDSDIGRALLTIAWTGVRKGELVALRWEDYAEGELWIRRAVYRGVEGPTKTDDPRRVAVVGPLAETIAQQRRQLVASQHPALSKGLMFPAAMRQARAGATRRDGKVRWYRSAGALDKPLIDACRAAGVPEISCHALRRTFEQLLRLAGVDQLVRRSLAGWRSERAQAIYAQVDPSERAAAAAALVRLVGGT